jgi:hypothetical protein
MKVYHGSSVKIINIDLSKCELYRDFGKVKIVERGQDLDVRIVERGEDLEVRRVKASLANVENGKLSK